MTTYTIYTDINDIPRRKYNVIYADPPWDYGSTKTIPFGGTEKHYQTMKTADICSLPIGDIAADDCFLFMWATFPKCRDWLTVLDAWGFDYKTVGFGWVKMQKHDPSQPRMGVGWYTKSNIEVCLLAVKGNPHLKFMGTKGHRPTSCLSNNVHSEYIEYMDKPVFVPVFAIDDPAVLAPRGEHSEKPEEVRRRIEAFLNGVSVSKIELFARKPSEGWDAWGNEVAAVKNTEQVAV